jgi:hypothetical protein
MNIQLTILVCRHASQPKSLRSWMKLRKLLKVTSALLILIAVAVGLTSIDHPIILKWVTGFARHFGKPIPATVYTNGQANDRIKVFYTDEPDSYLLSLAEYDSSGVFTFLYINLADKWIGRPTGMSRKEYDFISGHLFLMKSAERYTPIRDDMNGTTFDAQLLSIDGQIEFKLPPNKLELDSVRIDLP